MRPQNIFLSMLLILGTFVHLPTLANDDQLRWFKEEIQCDTFKLKVRSFCHDEGNEFRGGNQFCSKQEIVIQHSNGQTYKKPLTSKKYWKDRLTARSLLCMKNKAGENYFLISFANGGNCDFCEAYDLMDDKGNWLTKHGRNLGAAAKRAGLKLNPWPGDSFVGFSNTVVDEGGQQ